MTGTKVAPAENPRCVERVPDGGRSVSLHACLRVGTIQRDGEWYCGQHDPEKVKTKRAARDQAWKEREEAQDAIQAEGRRLAKRLGVLGGTYYNALGSGLGHYERALVIRFDEVERLIERLGKAAS